MCSKGRQISIYAHVVISKNQQPMKKMPRYFGQHFRAVSHNDNGAREQSEVFCPLFNVHSHAEVVKAGDYEPSRRFDRVHWVYDQSGASAVLSKA